MANDTAQLIDQVAGGKADVLGWSMGGYIAQELAIAHPDTIRRLVLASTDCGGPDHARSDPTRTAHPHRPGSDPGRAAQHPLPAQSHGRRNRVVGRDRRDVRGERLPAARCLHHPPATAAAQVQASGPLWLGKGHGTCDRLGRITQATLIASGVNDVVVPSINRHALIDGIRRYEVQVYRHAGTPSSSSRA